MMPRDGGRPWRRGAQGRVDLLWRGGFGSQWLYVCYGGVMRLAVAGGPRSLALPLCALLIGASENACSHREPPAPASSPSVARPEDFPAARAPASSPPPEVSGDPAPATRVSPITASPSASAQTTERPAASGAAFDARARALWDALVRDDPAAAMPFFFPLVAYRCVKDVADPDSDWKHRLVAAYERDIHELHARLGAGAERATFIAIDVPSARARWVDPGEEWNKIGYFRVFGAMLRYSVAGHERALPIRSLISWRGQWYVVHLRAG